MPILLFLVDTSASMAQRNYQGVSALDTAKALIDDLYKQRNRDVQARGGDRYMLLSTEDFPACVKTGWREGIQVLKEQLKSLRPCGRHPLKAGIISAFQFVNMNRSQTGVDNYGHGRYPFYQEPVFIITISDANSCSDIPSDFELHGKLRNAADAAANKPPAPGTELTEELFRWDQRMFSIVLRMGAEQPAGMPSDAFTRTPAVGPDSGPLQRICASTGGRSFAVTSHRQLGTVVEQIINIIQMNGVLLKVELPTQTPMPLRNGHLENGANGVVPIPTVPGGGNAVGGIEEEARKAQEALNLLRKQLAERGSLLLISVPFRKTGHWPIPEAFWPENVQGGGLPPRKAHPVVSISLVPVEAQLNVEFPFDKYELEPGPLSNFVLERAPAAPNLCYQVFVNNSYRAAGPGRPFGYLKATTNMLAVNLFIMPYNYPFLLRLLDDQKNDIRIRSNPEWRRRLNRFIDETPSYYHQAIRKAFLRIKLNIEDPQTASYLPPILNYLTKCKHIAKEDFELRCTEIAHRLRLPPQLPNYRVPVEKRLKPPPPANFRVAFIPKKRREDASSKHKRRLPATKRDSPFVDDEIPDPEASEAAPDAPPVLAEFLIDVRSTSGAATAEPGTDAFKNPFSIGRARLVEMLPRLALNLKQHLSETKISKLEGGIPGQTCRLQNAYELHNLPVHQMGNYEQYMRELDAIGFGPMREVVPRMARDPGFGNPFKKDKKNMAVDEVGEALPSTSKDANSNGLTRKERQGRPRRKPGPLAANSLLTWRERRKSSTIGSSSVASDASHTMEDLSEDMKEAEEAAAVMAESVDDDDIELGELRVYEEVSSDEEEEGLREEKGTKEQKEEDEDDCIVIEKEIIKPEAASDDASRTSATSSGVSSAACSPTPSNGSGDTGFTEWGLDEEADDDDDIRIIEDVELSTPPVKMAKLDQAGVPERGAKPTITAPEPPLARKVPQQEKLKNGRPSPPQNDQKPGGGGDNNSSLPRAAHDNDGFLKKGARKREEHKLSPRRPALTDAELRDRKQAICAAVRQLTRDSVILAEMDTLIAAVPECDRAKLLRFAFVESGRFKRAELSKGLQERLNQGGGESIV